MGELFVTPDELRATAEHLADTSRRMKDILQRVHWKMADEGAPWGDDRIGHHFADGDHGYLGQVNWVDGSIKAKTDLLDQYAEGLHTAADTLEAQDQG